MADTPGENLAISAGTLPIGVDPEAYARVSAEYGLGDPDAVNQIAGHLETLIGESLGGLSAEQQDGVGKGVSWVLMLTSELGKQPEYGNNYERRTECRALAYLGLAEALGRGGLKVTQDDGREA